MCFNVSFIFIFKQLFNHAIHYMWRLYIIKSNCNHGTLTYLCSNTSFKHKIPHVTSNFWPEASKQQDMTQRHFTTLQKASEVLQIYLISLVSLDRITLHCDIFFSWPVVVLWRYFRTGSIPHTPGTYWHTDTWTVLTLTTSPTSGYCVKFNTSTPYVKWFKIQLWTELSWEPLNNDSGNA